MTTTDAACHMLEWVLEWLDDEIRDGCIDTLSAKRVRLLAIKRIQEFDSEVPSTTKTHKMSGRVLKFDVKEQL